MQVGVRLWQARKGLREGHSDKAGRWGMPLYRMFTEEPCCNIP